MVYADTNGRMAQVYLVTRTEQNAAYGLATTILYTEGAPMVTSTATVLWQNGFGLFHVDPRYVQALAHAPTPQGMKIIVEQGGLSIVSQGQGGTTKTSILFDPKSGVILNSGAVEYYNNKGSMAVVMKYLGYQQVNWPVLPDFPPAARQPARYAMFTRVYNWTGGGAMESPLASVEVAPLRVSLPLAQYRVVMQPANAGPMPQTELGLPAEGPHYVHPALLRRNPVYEVPQLGLTLTSDGQSTFTLTLGGQPLVITRVDPNTGLILEQTGKNPLGEIVFRLAQ